MRIKIEGGFVNAGLESNGKISLSVGCEHFNPDGTRKETVVNTAQLTEQEVIRLFSDVFEKNKEDPVDEQDSDV